MEPIEEFKHAGLTVRIEYDEDAENPRTAWDNLGTMVCFHGRYRLGDANHGYAYADYSNWIELRNAIQKREEAAVVLPLFLYDHSGLAMSTEIFRGRAHHAEWDSGQVGWIFVSKAKVREEYYCKRITAATRQKVEEVLKAEVETYSQFLNGEVYGFTVEDAEGNHLDSCWGFFGLDYCREQAKEAAEHRSNVVKIKAETVIAS